jgi:hypothetical protein
MLAETIPRAVRVPGTKHSWEVICRRCRGRRWTWSLEEPDRGAYLCIRCRAAVAGRNVEDPVLSPGRQHALNRARAALQERFLQASAPRSRPTPTPDPSPAP